jgi:hypothetical protein
VKSETQSAGASYVLLLNGVRTVEYVGRLKRAMLGEGPRQRSPTSAPGASLCYRNLRCQRVYLFFGELETKVPGETGLVALHRLVEPEGLHALQTRQIDIQDNALASYRVDDAVDGRNRFSRIFHKK